MAPGTARLWATALTRLGGAALTVWVGISTVIWLERRFLSGMRRYDPPTVWERAMGSVPMLAILMLVSIQIATLWADEHFYRRTFGAGVGHLWVKFTALVVLEVVSLTLGTLYALGVLP